tara:strand:- start:1715 stop:2563 length:849 start_codon:yes stop_codon:yes gene_type:complete
MNNIIGNTPLIKLNEHLWAKLETYNPTGSVKDRMAHFIFGTARSRGELEGKHTIVEATSGNTGIAFARIGAINNMKVVIVMPYNMSDERKKMMRLYGAKIIEAGHNAFKDAIKMRDELVNNEVGYWSPMQFSNGDNILCHHLTTGPEIFAQTRGYELAAFVSGAGTGGTMMGVKRYFDAARHSNPKFVLAAPAESASEHGIQGINDGEDFLLDTSQMDQIIKIKTDDAIDRAARLARENGLLVGISAGANVLAAERWIEEHNPEGVVVTMLCDRGERYMGIL